jgi:hypothetical protein
MSHLPSQTEQKRTNKTQICEQQHELVRATKSAQADSLGTDTVAFKAQTSFSNSVMVSVRQFQHCAPSKNLGEALALGFEKGNRLRYRQGVGKRNQRRGLRDGSSDEHGNGRGENDKTKQRRHAPAQRISCDQI